LYNTLIGFCGSVFSKFVGFSRLSICGALYTSTSHSTTATSVFQFVLLSFVTKNSVHLTAAVVSCV
jgi:hypothetical protein